MSFADLKKKRGSLEELSSAAENAFGGRKNYSDDRFWNITRDKEGNGVAIIRFLPSKNPDELPWIQYWDHGFQGPTGAWYIEKSLTTLGQDDPVGVYNQKLWNSGEEGKARMRELGSKRRLHYVANVLVLSDPANPENEGKVFLYKFGKKIFEKIKDAMQPDFPDDTPINPFDFWDGANFKLRVRKVDGWVNYDKSEFTDKEALFDGDEKKLEEIYEQLHDLQDLISPDKFKSYTELETKLNRVLGIRTQDPELSSSREAESYDNYYMKEEVELSSNNDDDDDDDALSYFQRIAAEDSES